MKNKRITAVLAVAMITAVLSGCGNNAVSSTASKSESSAVVSSGTDTKSEVSTATSTTNESVETSSSVSEPVSTASSAVSSNESTASNAAESNTAVSETSTAASKSDGDTTVPTGDLAFGFEFSIDNERYTFPFKYSDLEKNGWKYDKDVDKETVKAHQYLIGPVVVKDNLRMAVQPLNLTDSEITAKDANIGKVSLHSSSLKSEEHEVKYGNIVLGKSTMDDVKAAFGEPTSTYDSETYPTVTYKKELYVEVKFGFDNAKGGIVNKIDIQYFKKT